MPHSFSPDWLKYLSDPFSVVGVSVLADDKRASKRYRSVAKILRPDISVNTDPETGEFIAQLFARFVNPSYEKIKQEKGRAETLALMRLQVRRALKDGTLIPQTEVAQQLSRKSLQEADVFYEQAIANLAALQYEPLENFQSITQQINELNLVYLKLKMGGDNIFIGERRTGVINPQEGRTPPPAPSTANNGSQYDYADRHYRRAQEYMKKNAWSQAVLELKDALKMEPNKGDYHSLIGLAYWRQDLRGMAKSHFRRALQIDPNDQIATHFATLLDIQQSPPPNGSQPKPDPKKSEPQKSESQKPAPNQKGGLFGLFRRK
jgi:tetratricopeptide (TPR) repeat protein